MKVLSVLASSTMSTSAASWCRLMTLCRPSTSSSKLSSSLSAGTMRLISTASSLAIRSIDPSDPLDRFRNSLFENDLWCVSQVPLCAGDVWFLVLDIVLVLRKIGHHRILLTQRFEDNVRQFMNAAELYPSDVVNTTRFEPLDRIGERRNKVVYVHKDS